MAKLEMNTNAIKAAGEELREIAKDLNKITDEVYTKLSNVQVNDIWLSEKSDGSVNVFVEKIQKDKPNVENFSASINSLGNTLINYANSINSSSDIKL